MLATAIYVHRSLTCIKRAKASLITNKKITGEKKAKHMLRFLEFGAGKEARTPDLNLGKVALYQLSYSRKFRNFVDHKISVQP